MARVLVIGAPSGTGKTTLLKRLLGRDPRLGFSVSHTTRAIRPGEQDGRDYHFVGREEFERRAAAGEFLEWATVYGNLYGTHRGEIERAERAGVDLILDIDVQGAASVRRALPGAAFALIVPPSWQVLERRLRERGTETPESLERRLRLAREQVRSHELYDYVVVNADLERATGELEAIVAAERLRREERRVLLEALLADPSPGPL